MDTAGGREESSSRASSDRGRAEVPSSISESSWGGGVEHRARGQRREEEEEDSQDRVDRTGDPHLRGDCLGGPTGSAPPGAELSEGQGHWAGLASRVLWSVVSSTEP